MVRLSTSGATDALAGLLAGTLYISLHSADPGTTGASEIADAGYARQSSTFTAGANTGALAWTTTGTSVPYIGVWSAVTAGTYKCGLALSGTVSAASITAAASALAFTAS